MRVRLVPIASFSATALFLSAPASAQVMAQSAPIEAGAPTDVFDESQAILLSAPAGTPLALSQTAEVTVESELATAVAESQASAPADQSSISGEESGWDVAFTPYLWIAGTKGIIGIPRDSGEVEIDKSFTDLLGSLKFAFMGALDVHRNRVVGIADIMYLSVGAKVDGIRDNAFTTGEVDASVFLSTLAVGYRVVDQGPMFVDLFAGARLSALKVDLELEGPLTTRRAKKSASRVGPLVGGRIRIPLAEDWAFGLYGDVSTSTVKWQLLGTVQWRISRHWRMLAGYRHMAIHHDKKDFEVDVDLSGPILGFSYHF